MLELIIYFIFPACLLVYSSFAGWAGGFSTALAFVVALCFANGAILFNVGMPVFGAILSILAQGFISSHIVCCIGILLKLCDAALQGSPIDLASQA